MKIGRILFGIVIILAMLFPLHSGVYETSLTMNSDPGDYIGQGQQYLYTTTDGTFTAERNNDNGVSISFQTATNDHWWQLDFAAPNSQPLTISTYSGATRYPFQDPSVPGLSVYGDGRGCNELTGSFEVKQVIYGTDDTIISFWATFEQHCEGMTPALSGDIRFNLGGIVVHSADFNGDSLTEETVFRPSNGTWYVKGGAITQWGTSGDIPVSGYYNYDTLADIAVWRPSDGNWYIKDIATVQWGTSEDIPVPGNYGGDSRTDFSVWRPSEGNWYIRTAEGSIISTQWGTSGDIPVPGNYGGDIRTDFAVFRPSNGKWYIKTAEGNISAYQWGTQGDIPVPGDYNSDGVTEIAVFRPSEGNWYIKGIATYQWGASGDIPVPGDYNGDGITDIVVWRPSKGNWYLRGIAIYQWGTSGDVPLGEQ
jgi:hypothetical protein